MAGSGEKWRWADPQGVQRVIHSDELRAAIGSGTLPPYILVWRPGMAEWQPAYQVAEVATVAISAQQGIIPNVPPPPPAIVAVQAEFEHRVAAFDARKSEIEEEPPPPPVHQYAAIAAAVPAHLKTPAPAPAPTPERAPEPEPELEVEPEPEPVAAAPPAPTPPPPPIAPRISHTPKPPVVVPPRATPSVLPPRVVDLSPLPSPVRAAEPSVRPPDFLSRPPSSHAPGPISVRSADVPHAPGLPSLPGMIRSAPPPPPPRRSQPVPPHHGSAAHGQLPLPAAPLPLPPPARFLVDARGPGTIVMPVPPPFSAPSTDNGGPSALAPEPIASPFAPLSTRENGAAGVDAFPAFPLDETKADIGRAPLPSDPVELPFERGIGSKMVDGLRDARDSLRPLADRARRSMGPLSDRAKHSIGPLAHRAKESLSPLSGRAKRWVSTKVLPALESGFAYVKANPKDPKVLLGLGGVAVVVFGVLIAVAATSGSNGSSARAAPETSASRPAEGVSASPASSKVTVPAAVPTPAPPPAVPAACRLTKDAVRLAGSASKDVPIELTVNDTADRARVGFATGAGFALGLAIDLASFRVTPEFSTPVTGSVRAVVPPSADGAPAYVVNADGPGDKLRAWRALSGAPSSVIGWADGSIAIASKATDAPTPLWRLEGDDAPDTIRVAPVGDGQAVVLRRHGEILGGILDSDRKPVGSLVRVEGAGVGAGSPVGAPFLAANASSVAIVFADRADSSEPWVVRVGSSRRGSFPSKTSAFATPAGGPGGVAIAPALAGLSSDRWLLVWTEGGGGDHDVRAQTLNDELQPIGAAFTVSRAGGNAGQGAVALNGGQGLVTYLTLTPRGYELWGAGVDCR